MEDKGESSASLPVQEVVETAYDFSSLDAFDNQYQTTGAMISEGAYGWGFFFLLV